MAKRLFKTLVNGTKRFVRDEEGQSTVEYILILAIAVMVAMKFRGTINKSMDTATGLIDTQINNALQQQ